MPGGGLEVSIHGGIKRRGWEGAGGRRRVGMEGAGGQRECIKTKSWLKDCFFYFKERIKKCF